MAHRLELTRHNLQVDFEYLRIKLLSVGLLEALSLRSGPKVSLASLMGKLSTPADADPRLEHLLPPTQGLCPALGGIESVVVNWLESGQTAPSCHDARHSPMAGFLSGAWGETLHQHRWQSLVQPGASHLP